MRPLRTYFYRTVVEEVPQGLYASRFYVYSVNGLHIIQTGNCAFAPVGFVEHNNSSTAQKLRTTICRVSSVSLKSVAAICYQSMHLPVSTIPGSGFRTARDRELYFCSRPHQASSRTQSAGRAFLSATSSLLSSLPPSYCLE